MCTSLVPHNSFDSMVFSTKICFTCVFQCGGQWVSNFAGISMLLTILYPRRIRVNKESSSDGRTSSQQITFTGLKQDHNRYMHSFCLFFLCRENRVAALVFDKSCGFPSGQYRQQATSEKIITEVDTILNCRCLSRENTP